MNIPKTHLFISWSDLTASLKKGRNLILICGAVCALLAGVYLLSRPVQFTAHAILKGPGHPSNTHFLQVLEFLGSDDSYNSSDDPRTFLKSYPAVEGVVKALNLQATLVEKESFPRLRSVWHTLKAERAYKRFKQERPPSAILSGEVYVADELIVPDVQHTLTCSQVDFPSEFSASLTISFQDAQHFKVLEGKHAIGSGTLDVPFQWPKGSFTLSGKGKKGKRASIHFIPLEQAIQSVQSGLKVMRDLESTGLTHIRYTHRDRHLAAQIVNESMHQFQNFLKLDGKKKISQQLTYLRQRQEETMEQLEDMLVQQKEYLQSQLGSGLLLDLESELQFMAKTQTEKMTKLLSIQSEIEHLFPEKIPFQDMLNHLHAQLQDPDLQALSLEAAHEMIRVHQQTLDTLMLDKQRYSYCLQKLQEPACDPSSLAKILHDPLLKSRFERIHTLHNRLVDEKNWSLKEREQLKLDLETEKALLQEQTRLLLEGADLSSHSLKERIAKLNSDLLLLLADRHEQEMQSLAALSTQSKEFPEKWLREQKIELNANLCKEIMLSITKMIEAKNIGYNLDYLLTRVLKPASAPVFPAAPHLVLGMLLGGVAGILLASGGFVGLALWKGPLATAQNLTAIGRRVIPESETISLLGLALRPSEGVVVLTARTRPTCGEPLMQWLQDKGEKVFMIDFTSPIKPPFLQDGGSEALLASSRFAAYLGELKETNDRIIIIVAGAVEGFATQALLKWADAAVYEAAGERLQEVTGLPHATYFVIRNSATAPLLPLRDIKPKLETLMQSFKRSSFSQLHHAWYSRFPSKKT